MRRALFVVGHLLLDFPSCSPFSHSLSGLKGRLACGPLASRQQLEMVMLETARRREVQPRNEIGAVVGNCQSSLLPAAQVWAREETTRFESPCASDRGWVVHSLIQLRRFKLLPGLRVYADQNYFDRSCVPEGETNTTQPPLHVR